jgi:hypothetical protein
MPRKIKVVDVLPEIEIDDTVQQIDIDNDKPFEPIEEDIKKTIETVNIEEEQQISIIPETKVRTNELHACSKCGKFMTLKTLKYTHENTCSVGRIPEPPPKPYTPPPKPDTPPPKQKGRPKKEIVLNNFPKIQEEKETEEKQEVPVFEPEVRKSFETIRNERLRERVQQRTQRISNLFSQAF